MDAGKARTDYSFQEWIRLIFDYPVGDERADGIPDDWLSVPPAVMVRYLGRLFRDCSEVLAQYSNGQVNRGLWVIASIPDGLLDLVAPEVPWKDRRAAMCAMYDLFARCFKVRCSPGLSHLDDRGVDAINSICYMWFDIIPIYGNPHDRPEVDGVMLALLRQILDLPSEACQESALHGLGHWRDDYPATVAATIDEYLAANRRMRRELRDFALSARNYGVE